MELGKLLATVPLHQYGCRADMGEGCTCYQKVPEGLERQREKVFVEPPQEMTSLREIKQRLATIEERLELLLAIKDDTVRFRQYIVEEFAAIRGQISGGFDGTIDGYNKLVDELKQLTAAVSFFAETALNQKKTKRRSKK